MCAYCGERPMETRDHVVACGFFPEPLPSDMITVPCCGACSESFQKDEEYVRTLIVMSHDVCQASDDALKQLVGPVTRSFARPESAGLLNAMLDVSKPVELFSSGGIFLGDTRAIPMDEGRFTNVASKIVRGLHFYETGRRLGSDYVVKVNVVATDYEQAIRILKGQEVLWSKPKAIGDKVFQYSWAHMSSDTGLGVWLLEFYGVFDFLVLTLSPEAQKKTAQMG